MKHCTAPAQRRSAPLNAPQRRRDSHLAGVSAAPSTRGRRVEGRLDLVRRHSQTQTPTCWLPLLLRSKRPSRGALLLPGVVRGLRADTLPGNDTSSPPMYEKKSPSRLHLVSSHSFNQSPATSERRLHFVLLTTSINIDPFSFFFSTFSISKKWKSLRTLSFINDTFSSHCHFRSMNLLKACQCQPLSVLEIFQIIQ